MVDTIAPADSAEQAERAPAAPLVVAAHRAHRAPQRTTRTGGTIRNSSGLLLLTFAVLAAMSAAPLYVDDWFYRPRALPVMTVFVGVLTLVSIAAASFRRRLGTWSIPARLADILRLPSGDWPAFVLGLVLSLPLLAVYTPRLSSDSDSLRIIASIRHVQRGNLDFLVETQDSIGPHLVLGPILTVFGVGGLKWFIILSVQLLAGVVAWLTRRVSGSMLAAAVATIALLSITPLMSRTIVLPMYPTMLATGCLGCWMAYRVVVEGARWYYAAGSGFLLVLSQETHPLGQLLLAAPLLLLLLAPDLRRGLARLRHVYLAVLLVALPRLVVNFSEGGLSQLRSNRTDYWISEGYLRQIQSEFLTYPGVNDSYSTYLLQWPSRFLDSLGPSGWLISALALVALLLLRGRRRWLVVAFVGLIVASMTVLTIQPNPRYLSLLWPGLVALAGIAAAKLMSSRQVVLRVLGTAAGVALAGVFLSTLRSTALRADEATSRAEQRGYVTAAELIDDGRGIIGVRSIELLAADTELEIFGGQFLSEEDYVTFLTWPSDAEVIDMLERHDIGWVMTNKSHRVDIAYNNAWLMPNYGLKARHTYMLGDSAEFCRVPFDGAIVLWKLGECPPEVAPPDGLVPGWLGWPNGEVQAPERPGPSRPEGSPPDDELPDDRLPADAAPGTTTQPTWPPTEIDPNRPDDSQLDGVSGRGRGMRATVP